MTPLWLAHLEEGIVHWTEEFFLESCDHSILYCKVTLADGCVVESRQSR